MLLQKMIELKDGELKSKTCIVNTYSLGNEFTLCGLAFIDTSIEDDDFESEGAMFRGTIKQCTCSDCKGFLKWCKEL